MSAYTKSLAGDNDMKFKRRYTPETVEVQPIDMAKLNITINEFFHKDGKFPANIEYRARGTLALISQPNLCIIDDEFVGHNISEKVILDICEWEDLGDGHHREHSQPTHEVSLTLVELSQYLKPTVTLAEFTKERRGYNSRIRSNEADWVRYFNKS